MSASLMYEVSWKAAALFAQDPTISPEEPDPLTVTPGVIGFVTMALLAAVIVLLAFDMNRRIRRINYREQAREAIDAELAQQQRSSQNDQ